MPTRLPCLRHLVLTGAALLLLTIAPGRTHAAFLLTLTQSGGDVVVTGSGSLDLAALTLEGGTNYDPGIYADGALLISGPASSRAGSTYQNITGPASFGNDTNEFFADSGTGGYVGVFGGGNALFVPQGFVSNSPLTSTSTYDNPTLASLDLVPGTYVYTWGTGADADSLTITGGVPEPSARALLGLGGGVGLLGLVLRRRRVLS